MNHIKKALEESNNNLEEAKVWLKKKGFKEAENKMSRSANTKLFGLKVKDNQIAVASLSCETDFVSSTNLFRNYLNILLDTMIENKSLIKVNEDDLDKIKTSELVKDTLFSNVSLLEALKNLISKTQENCKIGICEKLDYSAQKFVVGTYLHSSPENNPLLGQKASYVVLELIGDNKADLNSLKELADNLAMQVVACNPKYLSKSDVPTEVIEKETKIIKEAILAEGKVTNPEQVDKIVNSKINSWFEEYVLNEQNYVIVDHESDEGKFKVSNLVSKKGKLLGLEDLKIREYKLYI